MPPVASDVTSLTDLAQALLLVAEDALATTTEGTPDRSYISPSAPAWDCCPFVAVHVQSLTEESTSPLAPAGATGMRTKYGVVNLATLVVTAVRCAPPTNEDGLPEIADIEIVAAQVEQDGWALKNSLKWAIECETFEDFCTIVHFDGGNVIPEQGGCVGWIMTLRAELGGIENPGCGS